MGLWPHKEPLTAERSSLQLLHTFLKLGREGRLGVWPCPHFSWDLIHVKRRQVYCRTLAFPWWSMQPSRLCERRECPLGFSFPVFCHPTAETATLSLLNFVLCLWFCLPLFLSVDVFVVFPPPLTRPAFCKMAPGQGLGRGGLSGQSLPLMPLLFGRTGGRERCGGESFVRLD